MRGKHFTYTMKRLAGLLLFITVVLLPIGEAFAAYNVNISGDPSVNGAWSGASLNVWTPNGSGSNVSVVDILTKLNAGGVTITEADNINVNATLSWLANTLTLNANNDININAVMSAGGASGLVMSMGTGTLKVGFAPGEANGFIGRVDFPGRAGSGFLTINGAGYTVINNLEVLQGIGSFLAGKYALGADIDASSTSEWDSGAGFIPIGGSEANSFTGIFDGLGHTVNNLIINRPITDNVGLFGYSISATMRNVGFVDGNVSGQGYVGGLAGYSDSDGAITNSFYSGVVSGGMNVGGMIGQSGGTIRNIYATGAVSGSYSVGGLVGTNNAAISNSYATSSVTGNVETGGLVGVNAFGLVVNSYSTGSVNGGEDTGGLVGYNFDGSITNSYATGSVTGTDFTGGLIGRNVGTVTDSFWDTLSSGQSGSDGGTPKTTTDMMLFSTFTTAPAAWDISASADSNSIWRITEGQTYPILRTSVPPAIGTSSAATAISTSTATLNGTVSSRYADTTVSFEYGPTMAYGTSTAATPGTVLVGSGNTAVSAAVSYLTPGQTYHYRAVATNNAGTVYGEDVSFTALNITLNNLNATYDGTQKAVTATTIPAGIPVTLTYAGSATAPTAAGTYTVVATFSQGNYSGSITGSLDIAKATATLTLGNLSQIYNGSARTVSVSTNPAGLAADVYYNGSSDAPTVVGNYQVIVYINDNNYQGSAEGTLVIGKATATVTLGGLNHTYDGASKAATATTTPAGLLVSYTYNGSATVPIEPGTYPVVVTVNDNSYSGSVSGSLTIAKAAATVTLGNLTQTYNGSARTVSATTNPAGKNVTIKYNDSPTAPTAAGSYPVVGTIEDTYYQGTATGTLVINKATTSVVLASLNQTYNGSVKSATASTVPAGLSVGLTYDNSQTLPTAAGIYAVIATINDTNYSGSTTGYLTIAKAAASVELSNLAQTYNGTARSATIVTNPPGLGATVTYNGNAIVPISAGTYDVVAAINDTNYSGSTTGSLTIARASATVGLSNLSQVYNGSARSITVVTSPAGLDTIVTYDGAGTVPTSIGSYEVVGLIDDPNYSGSTTSTLVITPPPLTVYIAGTGTGTVTSSPAGISCNKSGAADFSCTNTFSGTVNLYATPSVSSLFKGWGACSGLGVCSVTMSAGQTVSATFDQAPLLHIDGTIYPSLQAAYDAAADGAFIQLLDNTVAGTLDANKNFTVKLKGGYDAGYTNNSGTTALTAPLTIRLGTLVIDRIVIK